MEFPVDVLEATSHGELERSAHNYMDKLLYTDPDHAHHFTLPTGKMVQISLSSVGFVPLYGTNLQHKVLALFTPQDQLTAVALFVANQWYSLDDILKTVNPRREGLIKVRSVGERIVLYVLNRFVYRSTEMESGEMPFLCHSENDYAKILWKNGQAVGFYSVKPKGSVCNNSLKQCYVLPVMDSIFVRKAHRGKGYGLQMLEDFVDSFNEDELGLKYPLSPAITNVCRHYLDRYPADLDLFWEVESIGGPYQRTRVASKLNSTPLNVTCKGGHADDDGQNGDILEDQVEDAEETSLNITEEVIVVNKHHKITKELGTPIATCTERSELKRRKRGSDQDEAMGLDRRPSKINRMEIAEDEKNADESVPEAHTETPIPGADTDCPSAIRNSTGVEEVEEMEVKDVAEEHQTFVQKTVEEPSAEQQEAAPVLSILSNNQEIQLNSVLHLQRKKEGTPAAKEDKEVDTPEAKKQEVALTAEEKPDVPPAAEESQEIVYGAEKEKVEPPVSKKKQEEAPSNQEEVLAPLSDEKEEGAPSAKKDVVVAVTTKEVLENAPVAKDQTSEQECDPSIEEVQEVALDAVDEVNCAAEEEVASETSDDEVEKQEVEPPTNATSSSVDSSAEGEDAAQKEDETDEEEETASDLSGGPGARSKSVPPASKRTSQRLSKMTLEDGEEEQGKGKGVEKEMGMSTEGKKLEDAEHSSDEEAEQGQDLPVIDKRVLRGKSKVQTMQRTRGKRRGKM